MLVVGVVLLAITVLAVLLLVGQNTTELPIHLLGWTWTVQVGWLVVSGVVLTAGAMAGLLLAVIGAGRNRRRAVEARTAARRRPTPPPPPFRLDGPAGPLPPSN
jgi:uncharacterized integral membrane protein